MYIFSSKADNIGRQTEIDLLRGFVAMFLIICHIGLYLGNSIDKGLWTFCDIIGSEPCAPIFMMLMGICMVYSRNKKPKEILSRGIKLFLAGYTLNFFRSILPLLILENVDEWASIQAFFVVDILQFAGLSFILMSIFKKIRMSNFMIFGVSVALVILNQFLMLPDSVPWRSEILTGTVNLFCPITKWSCFPLLTWFIFPGFGLVYGDLLKHCTDKNKLYMILLPIGLCGFVYIYYQFYRLYPDYTSYYWGNNFYYMGLKNALLTLLYIFFCLAFCFFAGKVIPNIMKRWLVFLSKNLNAYYVISWILISVLIHAQAVYGWEIGNRATIGLMVLSVVASAGITKLWLSLKRIAARFQPGAAL